MTLTPEKEAERHVPLTTQMARAQADLYTDMKARAEAAEKEVERLNIALGDKMIQHAQQWEGREAAEASLERFVSAMSGAQGWTLQSSLYEGFSTEIWADAHPPGKRTIAVVRDYTDAVAIMEAISARALSALPPTEEGGEPAEVQPGEFGWAPGGYMIACMNCRLQASDSDKRAIHCKPCAQRMKDEALVTSAPEETAWLIEETWSGFVHYIHKDFNCAKWAAENRKNDAARRNGVTPRYPAILVTKDLEQAMRFPTKEAAELWQSMQPTWLRVTDQYQIREHMWPSVSAPTQAQDVAGLVEGDLEWLRHMRTFPHHPQDKEYNARIDRILSALRASPISHETKALELAAADGNHKALVDAQAVIHELQHIRIGMLDHYQAHTILERLVQKSQALAAFQSRQDGKL